MGLATENSPKTERLVASPPVCRHPSLTRGRQPGTGERHSGGASPPGARAQTDLPKKSGVQGPRPLAGVWGRSPPSKVFFLLLLLRFQSATEPVFTVINEFVLFSFSLNFLQVNFLEIRAGPRKEKTTEHWTQNQWVCMIGNKTQSVAEKAMTWSW